mgnify:CR=1 FL=1
MENLIELNNNELLNIQGGDKYLRNLGISLGKIGGWLENMAEGFEWGTIHCK